MTCEGLAWLAAHRMVSMVQTSSNQITVQRELWICGSFESNPAFVLPASPKPDESISSYKAAAADVVLLRPRCLRT
jgi:hypothetical protein